MTIYPTYADVIEVHHRLIERFGGSEGIRDANGIEAALGRPQSGYYSDLIEEAAALWESLSQNHPFIDGNKRVSITVTMAFLRVNGYRIRFDDLEAYEFLIGLYEGGQFRAARLADWLRQHCTR